MLSQKGKEFIKRKEALRLKAYQDEKGIWTIGWGHTGPEVVEGLVWTREQAVRAFDIDCETFTSAVLRMLTVPPTQDQLDALVSLTYNIGKEGFRTSTVRKLHNAGNFAGAGAAFAMWNKITDPVTKKKRVSEGLTKRRAEEAATYLTERADRPHTTAATPLPEKDPATSKVSPESIVAGVGAAAETAKQTVANVSSVWDTINALGIDPRMIVTALGVMSICAIGYFVYQKYMRNKEGDR